VTGDRKYALFSNCVTFIVGSVKDILRYPRTGTARLPCTAGSFVRKSGGDRISQSAAQPWIPGGQERQAGITGLWRRPGDANGNVTIIACQILLKPAGQSGIDIPLDRTASL